MVTPVWRPIRVRAQNLGNETLGKTANEQRNCDQTTQVRVIVHGCIVHSWLHFSTDGIVQWLKTITEVCETS